MTIECYRNDLKSRIFIHASVITSELYMFCCPLNLPTRRDWHQYHLSCNVTAVKPVNPLNFIWFGNVLNPVLRDGVNHAKSQRIHQSYRQHANPACSNGNNLGSSKCWCPRQSSDFIAGILSLTTSVTEQS